MNEVVDKNTESRDVTTAAIRILIVDSQNLTRTSLAHVIQEEEDMQVVGQAGSPKEGLDLAAQQKPDIILLEINPLVDMGLELIPTLLHHSPQAKVILVTGAEDQEVFLQAVQNGAMGVVTKSQPPEILFKAIRKVRAGEAWLDHALITNLLSNFILGRPAAPVTPEATAISQLSEREIQVIHLIGRGLKNKQIALHLSISETTVRHHLTSVYSKLGVSDRLELLVFAQRYGLLGQV